MADKAWADSIKNTNQLNIFNGISGGKWANVFDASLKTFNRISGLDMKMVKTKNKAKANVIIQNSNGSEEVSFDGNSYQISFSSSLNHGKTKLFGYENTGWEIGYILLPNKTEETNTNALTFVVLHELAHVCGLEDHASDGVLMTLPNMQNGKIWAQKDSRKMPPFFFDNSTVSRLKNIWN